MGLSGQAPLNSIPGTAPKKKKKKQNQQTQGIDKNIKQRVMPILLCLKSQKYVKLDNRHSLPNDADELGKLSQYRILKLGNFINVIEQCIFK